MPDQHTPAITVRSAAPGDGAALLRVSAAIDRETDFLGTPGEGPPWANAPDAYLQSLAESGDGVFLVATDGAAIVGYLGATAPRAQSARGAIYLFAVGLRASHRGRRLGARLIDAVEDWARARGAWRLELRVVVDNRRALALYRACGFEIEGRMTATFAIGEVRHDTYWMVKRLAADDEPASAAPFDLTLSPRSSSRLPPPWRTASATSWSRPMASSGSSRTARSGGRRGRASRTMPRPSSACCARGGAAASAVRSPAGSRTGQRRKASRA